MTTFVQQALNGLTIGMIYALIALGYSMVYGVLKMVNFAHGDLCVLGAMFSLTLLRATGITKGRLNIIEVPLTGTRLVLVLGMVFLGGMLCSTITSLIIERLVYRPLRRASILTVLVSALGVSIALSNAMMLVFGREMKSFPSLLKKQYFTVLGATYSNLQVFIAILTILLLIGLFYLVNKTTLGRCIRAVALDKDMAGLLGINVNRVIVAVFALGASLGAVAGISHAMYYGQTYYLTGYQLMILGWASAVIGGIGDMRGCVIAGLLIGLLEAVGGGYLPILTGGLFGADYRRIFVFLVLIVTLVIKPAGILGKPEVIVKA
ncbi:MAG: branched-chain amino acid ABC transporter permease [Chloroflexi bacterium]|nr:branched-chain amino acid ABC transporter permease [Chloroflexota bacterium]